MKLYYCKLEENQGYRERKIANNITRYLDSNTYFQKLWPWATALTTLAIIFILTTSHLRPPTTTKQVIRYWCGSTHVSNEARVATQDKVISCYYNTPKDNSSVQLLPADIQPRLCTHINIAFARVHNNSIHLEKSQCDAIREVVKLKQINPMLKVLLSVGGAGENNGFPDMVINHNSRKIFIKSVKKILKDYKLDGIDLDWEFPVLHQLYQKGGVSTREKQQLPVLYYQKGGISTRERQHFSQLLREIRMEYIREKKDYILSVALAAPQTIVDVAYDVDQINLYVDFANIMTYDFHYYTKFTPFTGFNSPLFARSSEELFLASFNINYTVHMYQSKGLDRNKIVVGIPTYGHSFKLVNQENPGVGSPASGFGEVGGRGFVDYGDVCVFADSHPREVTLRFDAEARVPYLYRGAEWISYDSPESASEKAAFAKENNLRGAMIYSLNADDYRGRCAGAGTSVGSCRFPLARSVGDALRL